MKILPSAVRARKRSLMRRGSTRARNFPAIRQYFRHRQLECPVFDRGVLGPNALAECAAAGLVFTAIPKGTDWTIKVIGDGAVAAAVGTYQTRNKALSMASRLANELGGRAIA